MLNRRHIRTKVIQSIYSNSIESIDEKIMKTLIYESSSSSLDLLYNIIDFVKENSAFTSCVNTNSTSDIVSGHVKGSLGTLD